MSTPAIRARLTWRWALSPSLARASTTVGLPDPRGDRCLHRTCRASSAAMADRKRPDRRPARLGRPVRVRRRAQRASSVQHRDDWVRLLEGADFGSSFRGGWVLDATPVTPADRRRAARRRRRRHPVPRVSAGPRAPGGSPAAPAAVRRSTARPRTPGSYSASRGTDSCSPRPGRSPPPGSVLDAYIRMGGEGRRSTSTPARPPLGWTRSPGMVQEACAELPGTARSQRVVCSPPATDAATPRASATVDELAARPLAEPGAAPLRGDLEQRARARPDAGPRPKCSISLSDRPAAGHAGALP